MPVKMASARNSIGKDDLHRRAGFPSINNEKKIHYDDVPTTYSPISTNAEMKNERGIKEKTLQFLSVKRRPHLILFLTYTSIFMIGVALGFTPFIKVYIDTCQDDRQVIENLPVYFNKMNKILEEMVELTKKLNHTKTENILAHYPQLANMYIKTAYGIGNSNISITCPAKVKILFIEYSGTKADKGTIKDFNRYCEKNTPKGSGSSSCTVSLSLVYGGIPYADTTAFTVIQYRCEHG